jgi:hypothetical protein
LILQEEAGADVPEVCINAAFEHNCLVGDELVGGAARMHSNPSPSNRHASLPKAFQD